MPNTQPTPVTTAESPTGVMTRRGDVSQSIVFDVTAAHAVDVGWKTQDRRPFAANSGLVDGRACLGWGHLVFDGREYLDMGPSPAGNPGPYLHVNNIDGERRHRVYPRHQVGDVLWVREGFAHDSDSPVVYKADKHPWTPSSPPWRSPMHMPRTACRNNLLVKLVRLQRLHDITDEDVLAEGISTVSKDGKLYKFGIADRNGGSGRNRHVSIVRTWPGSDDFGWHWHEWCVKARDAYAKRWEALYGKRWPWHTNPWVVATTFEKAPRV